MKLYEILNFQVWRSVCGVLHQIRTLTWANEDLADSFDVFVTDTLRPVLDSVGLIPHPGESPNKSRLRASLLPVLAGLQDPAVLAFAREQFRGATESDSPVPGNLRDGVFRGVMVEAGRQELRHMLMLYRQSELAEERVAVLQALGKAQHVDILAEVMEFALSPEVHAQDALLILVSAASSRCGHRHAWNFFV